jgi:hypothetical protein
MKDIKLSRNQADNYVIKAYVYYGLANEEEDLKIRTFTNGNFLEYHLLDKIYFEGKECPKLTVLNQSNYIYFLREGLKLKGYSHIHIVPHIKGQEVSYRLTASIVDYNYSNSHKSLKKKKR